MTEYADLFNAAVAAELRAERARKGITINALADNSGLAKSSVQRYLSGERDIPVPSLIDLCKVLSVDPRVIFERAEQTIQQD